MPGRTDLEQLIFSLSADINKMERSLEKAGVKTDKFARDQQRKYDRLAKDFGRSWDRVSATAGIAFAAISAYAIKAASDAEELRNAFRLAFGEGAKDAEAFADTLSKKVGRSTLEVQENMMRVRDLLRKQDAGLADMMTRQLVERSIDVASVKNVSDDDSLQKFLSGLSGESEPLKAFGIIVNETAVKLELLRIGFKGNATQAPEAAKQIARFNIMMRESVDKAGDAANTIGSVANQAKKVRGEFRDAAADFGTQFLPVAADVLKWASDTLGAFTALPSGVQTASVALLGLVAASGPLAKLITHFKEIIALAAAARISIAGVTVVGAGLVVGGMAIGRIVDETGKANLKSRWDYGGQPRNPRFKNTGEGQAYAAKVEAGRRAMSNEDLAILAGYVSPGAPGVDPQIAAAVKVEQERRIAAITQKATADADAAAKEALAKLPKNLASPVGEGAGKDDAKKLADRQTLLRIEGELATAEAAHDAAKIYRLEQELELRKLIADYEAAGYKDAARRGKAQQEALNVARREGLGKDLAKGLSDAKREKIGAAFGKKFDEFQALKDMGSQAKAFWDDQANQIERATFDATRDGILGGLYAIDNDDFGGYLKQMVKRSVFAGMAEGLATAMLAQAAKGGPLGSLFKFGAGLLQGFEGGGRTAGGVPIQVGERGREVFVPDGPGTIVPAHALRALGRQPPRGIAAPAVNQYVTFDNRGAMIWEGERARMMAYADQAASSAGQQAFNAAARVIPARAQRRAETVIR